ncbi:MAG: ATP-binding cassette domain-containing protein, partial [Gemmataceae bacterium]
LAGQAVAFFLRDQRWMQRRRDARALQMSESITIGQLVKRYLMERFNQTRLERLLADYHRSEWQRLRTDALVGPLLAGVIMIAGILMLTIGGRSILAGELTTSGLIMKAVGIVLLGLTVRAWVSGRTTLQKGQAAMQELHEFFERRVDPGQPMDAEFLQPIERQLDIVDLSYREPGTGRMILENVSVVIPKQTRMAILAPDPLERQTFGNLLARFLEPTAGEIRADAKNIRWVTHESLRTQIVIVTPLHAIFRDTIANNIGCGDPSFSLPQLIEAAKVAHAHQFIQSLPHGYETVIGSHGVSLTPGQQLRIGLARAIVRDPSVLVVEEPDDALDTESRLLLDDTYARIQPLRTVIILSRRASVLRRADNILVLHRGHVVAFGKHDELFASSPAYRDALFQDVTLGTNTSPSSSSL